MLQDTNLDGVADNRLVFQDDLQMLTGIAVGQGGVWAMCPPTLYFIPDKDEDMRPDGPPQAMLDGFTVPRENYHNLANGLSWGPDGWMYGRCGASAPGSLGVPGAGPEDRVPMRGGIWRFHPQRKTVEVLTAGTTNPWGHDWNEHGELFYINTVNGHLWHAITGAHFIRSHTIEPNPFVYQPMDMHADHWHFDTGKGWMESRDGAANDFGGGHAHIGMMIYRGSQWPAEYHGRLMTINMHGRRINVERLDRQGSGYVGRHQPDLAVFGDSWFRGLDLIPSPSGDIYIIDWVDTGECHEASGVHRTSGRIYRLQYGDHATRTVELSSLDPAWVAGIHKSGSQWSIRTLRVQLRTLQLQGRELSAATHSLRELLQPGKASTVQTLEALWTLFALDAINRDQLLELTFAEDEYLRNAAIKLAVDRWPLDHVDGKRPTQSNEPDPEVLTRLITMSASDPSPLVRLTLSSILQRLPYVARIPMAKGLVAFQDDTDDHNLPLMVWYGLCSLPQSHFPELLELSTDCQWPTTQRLISRRIAEAIDELPSATNRMLEQALVRKEEPTSANMLAVLQGVGDALAGRRKATKPAIWDQVVRWNDATKNPQAAPLIQSLSVLFGDGRQIDELTSIVRDAKQKMDTRVAALRSLVDARAEGIEELCLTSLPTRYLNAVAIQGLIRSEDPRIGTKILKNFRNFAPLDRPAALAVLASRTAWSKALIEEVQSGSIAREEISPFLAKQIANLGDPELTERLTQVWGSVRSSNSERQVQISAWKQRLTSEVLKSADIERGRLIFKQQCASCHRFFGEGRMIGPDLTGSQRSNLDYLLDNIVDPSGVVTADFRTSIVLMEDGRVLTGLILERNERTITLATATDTTRIPSDEVSEIKESANSLMPEGMLQSLPPNDVRDLFGYLQYVP